MDETGKVKDVPTNVNVLIRDKLENLRNQFGDLCNILQKLDINFKSQSKMYDSALVKGDKTFNDKNKITKAPDIQVSPIFPCSSNKTSNTFDVNAFGSNVLISDGTFNDETKTLTPKTDYLDIEYDASTSDTDSSEFSDCISETSSSTAKLLNNGLETPSSWRVSEIYSEVFANAMTFPNNNQISFNSVQQYSEGDSRNCVSEASTNNVNLPHQNTDPSSTSMISDREWEGLQPAMICSGNPTLVSEKTSNRDPALENESSTSDEAWKNEISATDEDWERSMLCREFRKDRGNALCDFFSDNAQKQNKCFKSTEVESDASTSAIKFSDSDAESCHSELTFSESGQGNLVRMNTFQDLVNIIVDIDQEGTLAGENSFHVDTASEKVGENFVNTDETMLKQVSSTLMISDDEWNRLSIAEKYDRDPMRSLHEFLSGNYEDQYNNFKSDRFFESHSDWNLSDNDQESCTDKRSRNILKLLNEVRDAVNKSNSSPPDFSNTGYQEAAIASEGSSHSSPALIDDKESFVDSDEMTDSDPDTLSNIFNSVLKYHPLKKFEIPPYESAIAERTLSVTRRNIDDSCPKQNGNEMPLYDIGENLNMLEECSSYIDSHSVMVIERNDCFSQNSSIICDALIKEYLNTAVKLNMLLLMKVEDIPIEDFQSQMDRLFCLDDQIGYFSAKLITTRNDWIKQFREINHNLRNNAQSITSSRDLYHMGILRICIDLAKILLKFCIEKQLELEKYENDLIFYHESHNQLPG